MDTNTKAVLVGANEVALQVVSHLKDGVVGEFEDFYQRVVTDAAFKQKLEDAYTAAKNVPAEAKAFTVDDYCDLVQVQVSYIPKFVHG